MNDKTSQGEDFDRDEETMVRLLRLAGPRPPVPADAEKRVYEKVQREWQASSQAPESKRVYSRVQREWTKGPGRPRITRRWVLPAALAASLLIVVAVVLQPPPPAPAYVPVGTIARTVGDISGGSLPASGHQIYPGERLATGIGQGLSVVLSNAESLRLDQNTTLIVDTKDQFRLVRGRVYADTGNFMYRERGLVIDTAMGAVTDVGTQFAVAVGDDHLDVAVREGRVDISRDSDEFVAVAGERMRIARRDGSTVDSLAPHDSYWDWATSLAPVFDIENKSLLDFLRWAARETGRELVFEDNELRMAAMRVDLHGSVADFEPLEAVESVLAGTKFRYRVEADRIVIER